MHNKDKYPEIWAAMQKAQEQLQPLMEERETHTNEIDLLQKQIDQLRVAKAAANDKAMANAGRIAELRREISRFAKAMGAVAVGQ